MSQRPFWFLTNFYGWVILLMSVVTAAILGEWWMILVGAIGYQAALLVDLIGGRSLGRTGAIRLAKAEQENRELRAEQARLLGAIRERDVRLETAIPEATPAPARPAAVPPVESSTGEALHDAPPETS